MHRVCNSTPTPPCTTYSFGISGDYSFDLDVAEKWGCVVFAADPTAVHPAQLHKKVSFHTVGAKMFNDSDNTLFDIVTSMPVLKKWLRHTHINILKMDCEGC